MSLPVDRGHVQTEQRHKRSAKLDALDTRACIELIIDDHRRVPKALEGATRELTELIDGITERVRRGGRLIYVGAGTSGRLGVLDASECPPTFQSEPGQIVGMIAGGDSALRTSSEGAEDDPNGARDALAELELTAEDTIVGIAAGGTTPYVLGAIRLAKAVGAGTALLTCAEPEPHPEGCDHLIVLRTGPELLTGSTRLKAGSATKLALNIITTTLFVRLGKVYSNLMVDLCATNEKLTDRAIRILIELCPELERGESARLLDRANGELKTAIVMQRLGVEVEPAGSLLAEHQGILRHALTGERAASS